MALQESQNKRIFLIGMPSSGKSTLGRHLAEELDYQFIDLDQYIETEAGKSIPRIFEDEGESRFRQRETNALQTLAKEKKLVLSTGGGTPCFHNNIDLMNQAGITVFIDVSVKTLTSRLLAEKENIATRPLMQGQSIQEYLQQTLQKRKPFYEKARIKLQNDNLTADDIMKQIQTKG